MRLITTGFFATTLLFLITLNSLNAQIESYDLSSYYLPDFNRQEFDVSLDFWGGFNNYNQNIASPINIDIQRESKMLRLRTSLEYNSLTNSEEKQEQLYSVLRLYGSLSNQSDDQYMSSKSISINPFGYIDYSNRIYFKQKIFFETGIRANYEYNKRKYDNTDSIYVRETVSNDHRLVGHLPIKFGYGRIEQVQDARQAIYIFDELRKENRTSREFSDEEITQFAQFLSTLKRERFFDYRLKRIENLEAIDSFLQVNNYLADSDARYFSTLLDMWDYGSGPNRESGSRLSLAIVPGYYLNAYKSEITDTILRLNENNYHGYALNGGLEYIYAKPINLYWQNTFGINGYFGIASANYITKEEEKQDHRQYPNILFDLYHKVGYYPNTRTALEFYYSIGYMQLLDATYDDEVLTANSKGFKSRSSLALKYYFSPRLSLNASTSLSYYWNDSTNIGFVNFYNVYSSLDLIISSPPIGGFYNQVRNRSEFDFGFNMQLTYSIF